MTQIQYLTFFYFILKTQHLNFKLLAIVKFLNILLTDLQAMTQAEYSPFLYNLQQTNQKQTTSYKKYPANKYYDQFDQQNDDVKQKLFIKQKYSDKFFMNDRVNQMIKIKSDHNEPHMNYQQRLSNKNNLSFKHQSRKSKEKHKVQQTKSCIMQKTKPKKSVNQKLLNLNQQKQKQLLMYKQLCLSLRKQNQNLSNRLEKQQKRQNKFSGEICGLKQKVRKLYDHCIEKNKSSKNVDYSLKEILKTHLKDKNSIKNNKENQSFIINNKSELNNKLKAKLQGKSNQQTIDTTTRASKVDLNYSSTNLKKSKSCLKQGNKKQIKPKDTLISHPNSQRHSNNYRFISSAFPKYDMPQLPDHDQKHIQSSERLSSQKVQENIYKEFFTTFVKSLEIFENESTQEHKSKGKLLRNGGYYVQWAKQQWLEIVQYLIKKGYVLGSSKNFRQKRCDSSIVQSRKIR